MSTKTRLWVLGTAIICGALILLGIVGGLMPQLASASATNGLAEGAEQLNEVQRAQLSQLEAATENSDELESQLDELRLAIPDTAASADWIEALHGAEESSGTIVTDFAVISPLSDPDAAKAAPPAAAETAPEGEAGDEAPVTAAPETAPQEAAGVSPIPITLTVEGNTRADVADFVRDMQAGDRLFIVTSVNIVFDEGASGPPWSATTTGTLYYASPES